MFHVWRKGGFAKRRSATGERAGTGDREGKIKATLSFIQYVFTPDGRRGIFGSLTHGQNNTDEKRREEYRVSHKHRALANECTAAVASPPQGAALLTDRAWLRVVIESNDN